MTFGSMNRDMVADSAGGVLAVRSMHRLPRVFLEEEIQCR
jgi:hypothetical protein